MHLWKSKVTKCRSTHRLSDPILMLLPIFEGMPRLRQQLATITYFEAKTIDSNRKNRHKISQHKGQTWNGLVRCTLYCMSNKQPGRLKLRVNRYKESNGSPEIVCKPVGHAGALRVYDYRTIAERSVQNPSLGQTVAERKTLRIFQQDFTA